MVKDLVSFYLYYSPPLLFFLSFFSLFFFFPRSHLAPADKGDFCPACKKDFCTHTPIRSRTRAGDPPLSTSTPCCECFVTDSGSLLQALPLPFFPSVLSILRPQYLFWGLSAPQGSQRTPPGIDLHHLRPLFAPLLNCTTAYCAPPLGGPVGEAPGKLRIHQYSTAIFYTRVVPLFKDLLAGIITISSWSRTWKSVSFDRKALWGIFPSHPRIGCLLLLSKQMCIIAAPPSTPLVNPHFTGPDDSNIVDA